MRGNPVGVLTIGGHDTKNCLSDFRYARQVGYYPSFTITNATFGKRARGYSIKTGLGLGEVSAGIAPDFGLVKVPKYAFDWIVADVGGNVTYDEKNGVYRIDCQKALRLKDNLTLTHGAVRNKGLTYEPVFDFVLRRGDMVKASREETCMLTVTDRNDNVPPIYLRDAWVLGTPFLENYCVFFNWLTDNDHGVAIAPSKLSGLTF
ncbi:hypothetical protein AAVH_42393 [Aphelenchoides avenae]|nr:hypothetical protein AAVH_42393 [Aphelenchus avenae]